MRQPVRRGHDHVGGRVAIAAIVSRGGALAMAAAAAITVSACRPTPIFTPVPPNIVLVTVDTLRADALGAYGGANTTPAIDRLAREGRVFANAACPMPLTRPSHFSIMTSLYPRQHGVVNNRVALPPEIDTLAEALSRSGYATAGFVGVRLLDEGSGAAQGFDAFTAPTTPFADADGVVPGAIAWLQQRPRGRPFFAWIHVFDPHIPYRPPAEYRGVTAPDALTEASWDTLLALAAASDGKLSAATLEQVRNLYAGEVRFVDHWIGSFVDALRTGGLLDDTVVAFTADHGECFENGIYFEHSECMYEGAVRVPLILRYPPKIAAGSRELRQVELLDIAPTLLELAGAPIPKPFEGRSLLADVREVPAVFEHPLYQQQTAENRPRVRAALRSVAGDPVRPLLFDQLEIGARTSEWKLLASSNGDELFDLRTDPGEGHNLADSRRDVRQSLRTAIQRWAEGHPINIRNEDSINKDLRETLRALGYIR